MHQNTVVSMMSPRRVPLQADPGVIQSAIRLTKAVQVTATLSGGSPLGISANNLMQGIPGGVTYWSRMRVQSVKVWAPSQVNGAEVSPILVVDTTLATGADMSWLDTGIVGQSRPKIAFKFGLIQQSTWMGVADDTALFQIRIQNAGSATNLVIMHAVLELMSPHLG